MSAVQRRLERVEGFLWELITLGHVMILAAVHEVIARRPTTLLSRLIVGGRF